SAPSDAYGSRRSTARWRRGKSNSRPITAATATKDRARSESRSNRRVTISRTRWGRASAAPGASAAPSARARTVSTATNGLPPLVAHASSPSRATAASLLLARASARTSVIVSAWDSGPSESCMKSCSSKLVDGVAKRGRIGQLLLAGGDDNEHRPGLDPPAEEGKQAQAHLISPVDVLQDQKCRPETGEMADRLSHGAEDLPVVGGTDGWLASRTRQLGDQACQLGAPDGSHA